MQLIQRWDSGQTGYMLGHRAAQEKTGYIKLLGNWSQATDDKGQYSESIDSLRGVLTRWDKRQAGREPRIRQGPSREILTSRRIRGKIVWLESGGVSPASTLA